MIIPITFIDRAGKPTTDYVRGYPCVRIAMFDYGDGSFRGVKESDHYWALIDSGADYAYASPDILEAIGAEVRGAANVNDGHGPSPLYRCFVVLADFNIGMQAAVISTKFSGEPYSAALGRFALEQFDFVFSKTEGGSYLRQIKVGA